jgi:hypothetical protein
MKCSGGPVPVRAGLKPLPEVTHAMRSNLLTAALLVLPIAWSAALGNPEKGDYKPVQGLENWDARLELEGLKQGKYNLIMRAKDQAGNVGYEGPYNVFVDPRSDLPVARISHPAPGSRAVSQLEVIGTCVDDDGVQSVQVSLDGGDAAEAKGTEFWSLPLDIASLQDGEHTLSAVGVDVNGLEGQASTVRFQVDKRAPLIRLTSHPSGALVSGKVQVKGEVEDPNGLATLAWSRDSSNGFQPLKMSLDKPGRRAEFELELDTRGGSDGPLVLWLQAADRTGSTGRQAFLLFVNNEAPVLEILSPTDEAAVHGKVLVVGRAADKLGLRGLQFDAGEGAAGSVPLTPGNPFWAQELDLSGRKAGLAQAEFTLENLAGVRRTVRLRLKVDPEADRPRLTLVSPQPGAKLGAPVIVSGFVQDEDPAVQVQYSLDGGAFTQVPASSAFDFPLEGLPSGDHKLAVRAMDSGGASATPVTVAFTVLGPAPRIALGLLVGPGPSAFQPGSVFSGDKDGRLNGTIRYSGPSLKAEYSVAGAAPRPLALKKGTAKDEQGFDIVLSKALPAGRVDVVVRATDAFGHMGEYRSFLFRGSEQADAGLLLVDTRLAGDAPVRLEPDAPLLGYLAGGPIQSVAVDPPTDKVKVSAEGAVLRVEAGEPGVSEPVRLQVTSASGSRYTSDPLRYASDFQAPGLELTRPATGDWLAAQLRLEGRATDAGGLSEVEYAIDGGDFAALAAPAGSQEDGFAADVALGALEDGPHLLAVRAVDRAGNATIRQVAFHKDATTPTLALLTPRPQEAVNGLTSLVGRAEDAGRIARIEVSEDGKSFREISRQAWFRVEVNLSLVPADKLLLRCTDAAGNTTQLRPQLALNLEADKPTVQIQLPAAGELLRDDFVVSGMVFDDDQVAAIRWRLDGGEFRDLEPGNSFRVPVSLAEVGDNEHTVEVQARDIGGLDSEIAKTTFMASTSDPLSALSSPGIAEQVHGVVELAGTSKDPNGIAEVRLSFDNGLSYFQASGKESWRYRLDTRLLADGTHAVLVQAQDSTGAVGLYTTTINIDNRAPELVLDTPRDGQVFTDSLRLDGRFLDNLVVASLTVSITPVAASQGAGRGPLEVPLSASGLLLQELDLKDLSAGWYNLRLEAADRAGNRSYVSRNFLRQAAAEAQRVELFYPADGETLAGPFSICGRVVARSLPESVLVTLDGQPLEPAPLEPEGWFRLDVQEAALGAGEHTLAVEVVLAPELRLGSGPRTVHYLADGPWVRIISHGFGDYVSGRPFLAGRAGWLEQETSEPGDARSAARRRAEHQVRLVEVSMDNGRSFRKAEGKEEWRYRLESQELASGELRLLVRATFENDAAAVGRTQLTVDTQAPEVRLLEPSEGGRFNGSLQLLGTAADESGLEEVAVSLREGDKSRYQVPSFIQGLYLDTHVMGATYWDLGLGLTFFDDNVKLQLQAGMSPPGRFHGLVLGAKLLANIATLPFSYLFGPSWDFFSMSLAVGANFSYFTMSEGSVVFTDAGVVLAGMVAQLEFARFKVPNWRMASTYGLYTEYQLWFISSDVEAGTASRLSFGLRIGLL